MKNLLITLAMVSLAFNSQMQICHDESGWCYEISTFQGFYMFGENLVTIDGELIAYAESKEEAYEELKTIIKELMGVGWEDVFICKDLGITKDALEELE